MTHDFEHFMYLFACHLCSVLLSEESVEIFLLIFIDMCAFVLSGLRILYIF